MIRLLDAEQPDETEWNRVRLNLRKATPAIQDLGQLLDENPAAMSVSDSQRARARKFLLDFAAEAAHRGHLVKVARRGQHAKLGYVVGGAQRSLELSEEYDKAPRQLSKRESRIYGYTPMDNVPSGRLKLKIGRAGGSNHEVWVDDKRTSLEARIRQIVKQVQAAFEEDERSRLEAVRKHEEWKAAEERRRAAEMVEWQEAMDQARPKAAAALRHASLLAALQAWRDARDMREICDVLDASAAQAVSSGQTQLAENLAAWRDGGLALADSVDPTIGPASLGNLSFDVSPTDDDLRPYLGKWSPNGPRPDYYGGPKDRQPSRPWPAEWSKLQR